MLGSRLIVALLALALAGGCTGAADDGDRSSVTTGASSTTVGRGHASASPELPWDQRSLEGDLVDLRRTDCSGRDCPLGIGTIVDAVEVKNGEPSTPRAKAQFAITADTHLFGCGPENGREAITFEELLERRTDVVGEEPTVVWTATAGVDDSDPVTATQVSTGSCG